MPRTENQKAKILYLLDYLKRETDEEHPATAAQLIQNLEENGITAERKSVYADIAVLRDYGIDVQSGKKGFFIAERDFQTAELKLLVDAVQSSKFITRKKTSDLIKKLEKLTSRYSAASLQRQVFVQKRIKNMRESIYYNVDAIHKAISSKHRIRFKYFRYDVNKNRVAQKDGAWYVVSPFALMWDNENYYLVAYDGENGERRHYRVDRMDRIEEMEQKREGEEEFRRFDAATYTARVFGMFGGREQTVTMRFCNDLANVVIDKLGMDIILIPEEETFTVQAQLSVSPQFYAWLTGLGTKAELLAPEDARSEYAGYIRDISRMYGDAAQEPGV